LGPAPEGWKLWIDDRSWPVRHKFLTGLGGFVALIIAISAISGAAGNHKSPTAQAGTTTTSKAAIATPAETSQPTATPLSKAEAAKRAKAEAAKQGGGGRSGQES